MLQLISAAIGNTWALPFENQFILWFQGLAGKDSLLYYLMNFISMFGEEMILVGIVGLVYWGFDKKRGERIGFMMISTILTNPLIKGIVKRTRPFDSGVGIENFRDVDGYSFPSGHSSGSSSTLVGATVVYKDKKYKWLIAIAVIIPCLVALSRTYLGAHYPTDVICGLALGVGVVFLLDWLYRIVPKYILYGAMLFIGAAGFFYCSESDFFTGYGILLGFVCGVFFEETITQFENTKVWWRIVLRVAVGGALFLGLNEGLKSIVGTIYEDYAKNEWFEHIFRVVRYFFVVFLVIGVYPLVFKPAGLLWKKIGLIKENTATETTTETDEESLATETNESEQVETNQQ